MTIKIVLDPGHGQLTNPYALPGYFEGTQMWKYHNFLKEELTKYGAKVLTTRPNIKDDPTLDYRGQMAGKNKADLFLSLHSDAYGSSGDAKVEGVTVFYSITNRGLVVLADKIGKTVAESMGTKFRGSQVRVGTNGQDYYGVIRASAQSGCKNAMLIEHGFHTNVKNANFLIRDNNLQIMAKRVADVIAQHYNLQPQGEQPSPWAVEAVEWAKKVGISDGTRLKDTTTREELITMLHRMFKLK